MTDRCSSGVTTQVDTALQRILRERARALAQREDNEALHDLMNLLLFRLGDEWYSFEIDGVREIHSNYCVTRIPCAPAHILGVINVRGEIVSVTDLGKFLQIFGRVSLDTTKTLPPAIIVACHERTTAVVVDEIGGIESVATEAIEPVASVLEKAQAEFVRGTVYLDGRLVAILNLEKIVEPIGINV